MRIVYLVPHRVSGAIGQRVVGVARALLATELVSTVTIVTRSDHEVFRDEEDQERIVTALIPRQGRSLVARAWGHVNLGRDATDVLDQLDYLPDVVLIYGGGALYMETIRQWARSRNVAVAADMVEWYDPRHVPLGRFGPFALDNHLMMTSVAPRLDGVIAISSFLSKHFTSTDSASVVVLPPLMDVSPSGPRLAVRTDGPVQLAYCGNPGKKDRLDLIMESVIRIDPCGDRLRLAVAGPPKERIARVLGLDRLPKSIRALGPISAPEASQLVADSHFVPLVREPMRFAQAGFPTKIAEAMSSGTPAIANLTSDLADVVSDGVTGFVVEEPTIPSIIAALERALEIPDTEYLEMRNSAWQRAREYFDYRVHVEILGDWLGQLRRSRARH